MSIKLECLRLAINQGKSTIEETITLAKDYSNFVTGKKSKAKKKKPSNAKAIVKPRAAKIVIEKGILKKVPVKTKAAKVAKKSA